MRLYAFQGTMVQTVPLVLVVAVLVMMVKLVMDLVSVLGAMVLDVLDNAPVMKLIKAESVTMELPEMDHARVTPDFMAPTVVETLVCRTFSGKSLFSYVFCRCQSNLCFRKRSCGYSCH